MKTWVPAEHVFEDKSVWLTVSFSVRMSNRWRSVWVKPLFRMQQPLFTWEQRINCVQNFYCTNCISCKLWGILMPTKVDCCNYLLVHSTLFPLPAGEARINVWSLCLLTWHSICLCATSLTWINQLVLLLWVKMGLCSNNFRCFYV